MKNKLITLPDQLAEKLADAAKYLQCTEMAVVRAGIQLKLKEVDEEMKRRDREREERRAARRAPLLASTSKPVGLGVDFDEDPPQPPPTHSTPPPQVIVMQSTASETPLRNDDLPRLADYVAAARDPFEKARREQIAVDVIRASTQSDADRNRLAAKLDEAVAARQKQTAPPDESALGWFKRMISGGE